MLFGEIRNISAKNAEKDITELYFPAPQASDMCLELAGALHDALVDGISTPHYLEYMSPDKDDAPQVVTRDIIRRAGRWGDSLPYTHYWRCTSRLRLAGNAPFPISVAF